MSKIKPVDRYMLVEVFKSDEKSEGGIVIPGLVESRVKKGRIKEISSGYRDDSGNLHPLDFCINDVVMFGATFGVEVGKDLIILHSNDIFAIVEE